MKRDQFRSMVKEIIKEVISEMDDPDEPIDDRDTLPDTSNLPPMTAKSDKKWRGKMRTLDKIHDEPEFKQKLNQLQYKNSDVPAPYKTISGA